MDIGEMCSMKLLEPFSYDEIKITLTRDSVCLADDMEDHTRKAIFIKRNPNEMTMDIAKGYLPAICGKNHYWECILNNSNYAVIHGNCNSITIKKEVIFDEKEDNQLHFKYVSAAN